MEQASFPHLHEPYLLGELSENDRQAFEAHTLNCPACAEEVVIGSRFIEAARSVLGRGTQEFVSPVAQAAPSRDRPSSWRRRLWPKGTGGGWPTRIAAVASVPLLAGVVYQGTVLVPRLQQERARADQPAVLTPITLRPPVRGPGPTIALPPQQRRLVLAVGPVEAGAGRLTVAVERGDGTAVVPEFAVETSPMAGEPLQIALPTAVLVPGDYQVVVRSFREQPGRVPLKVSSYPFSIVRTEHDR